jgi:hypothetical protein
MERIRNVCVCANVNVNVNVRRGGGEGVGVVVQLQQNVLFSWKPEREHDDHVQLCGVVWCVWYGVVAGQWGTIGTMQSKGTCGGRCGAVWCDGDGSGSFKNQEP